MIRTTTDNHDTLKFDSPRDIADFLSPVTSKNYSYHGMENTVQDGDKIKSYPDSLHALVYGAATPAAAAMDALAQKIKSQVSDHDTFQIEYNVTGQYLDIGRFVTGDPEAFGSMISEPAPQQSINITVNIAMSGTTTQEAILNRGAAIMALIDLLSKKYFVNIRVIKANASVYRDHGMTTELNLSTNNSYSRDLLAFLISDPAFTRRLCFAIMETNFKVHQHATYGRPLDPPTNDADIYFCAMSLRATQSWDTPEESLNNVLSILDNHTK